MRAGTRSNIALVLALACAAPGCSLVLTGKYTTAMCTSDTQCDVLNRRDGIAQNACARWQCAEGTGLCTLRTARDDDEDGDPPVTCGGSDCDDSTSMRRGPPAATGTDAGTHDAATAGIEVPDRVDNDCDGIVDNGQWSSRIAVSTGGIDPGSRVLALESGGGGDCPGALRTETVTPASIGPTPAGAFADACDGSTAFGPIVSYTNPAASTATVEPGCYEDVVTLRTTRCDYFVDGAVAAAGSNRWFAALVRTRAECAEGGLALGYVDDVAGASRRFVVRGGSTGSLMSNVYLTVDSATPVPWCTGQSVAARGASRPAIASLAEPDVAGGTQAIAAWVNEPLGASECLAHDARVSAMGLWMRGDTGMGAIPYVLATDEGRGADWPHPVPTSMETTRGARPAVLGWPGHGFFVAFGDSTGSLAIHFIPRLGDPGSEGSPPALLSPAWRSARVDVGAGATPVARVALAIGLEHDGALDLGAVVQIGCGATGRLAFQRITFRDVTTTPFEAGPRVVLREGADANEPSVIRVSEGILQDQTGSTGGWLASWLELAPSGTPPTRRAWVARISEPSLRVVDSVALVATPPDQNLVSARLMHANGPCLARHVSGDTSGRMSVRELLCRGP